MDMGQANTVELARILLHDVDEFSEWENGLGWQVDSTQLSAGANEIRFDHFLFPEMMVGHFSLKQQMRNVFAVPEGVVVFSILKAKRPAVWSGMHVPPSSLAVIRSGSEHWCHLPAGWDCYEFIITEDLIRRLELFPPSFFEATTNIERAFVPLLEPLTGEFLRRMDSFFRQGRVAQGTRMSPVQCSSFFDVILDGLLRVVDAGVAARDGGRVLRSTRRVDLLHRGTELVASRLTGEFSAEEMARTLGVSYRVLNYAFQDGLGVSPYQYILANKLHAVRRRLLSTDLSVTEASVAHGFHNLSRFAHQYRRLFGELPSDTRYPDRRRAS